MDTVWIAKDGEVKEYKVLKETPKQIKVDVGYTLTVNKSNFYKCTERHYLFLKIVGEDKEKVIEVYNQEIQSQIEEKKKLIDRLNDMII